MSDKGKMSVDKWFAEFNDEQKQTMRWFGQFISGYAQVESYCHVLFRRYCGANEKVARAISSGARLSDLISVLSVAIQSSDLPDIAKKEFALCMDQFGHLTALRHRLVHRGIEQSPGIINREIGQFHSSNVLTAKAKESIEILRFQRSDIEAAAKDCLRIYSRMQFMTLETERKSIRSVLEKDFAQELYGPWFYKPIQPDKPHKKTRH